MKMLMKCCLALFVLLQSSCATEALYDPVNTSDRLGGYLISADRENFVILGEKYHYIAPLSQELANITRWDKQAMLAVDPGSFRLNDHENVHIRFNLSVATASVTEEDQQFLQANGFEIEQAKLIYRASIDGQYYLAGNVSNTRAFSKKYTVNIIKERNPIIKAALTPVTVAVDGVMVLGVVALFSVFCITAELTGQCMM